MFTIIEIIIFAVGGLSSYLLWRKEGNKFNHYCVWLCLAIILGLIVEYVVVNIGGGGTLNGYFTWIFWIAAAVIWLFLLIKFSGKKNNMKSKGASNKEEVYAYYNQFINKTPTQIQNLKERLGQDGKKLDYSKESLSFVDKLMSEKIQKKPGYQAGLQMSDLEGDEGWLIIRLSYYIADFLIKNLGMRWELNTKIDSLDYSAPILVLDGTTLNLNPVRFILESGRNGKSIAEWYSRIEKEYKK